MKVSHIMFSNIIWQKLSKEFSFRIIKIIKSSKAITYGQRLTRVAICLGEE